MPVLFIYLLKLSVSLAVVFLFYQLLLRKLTFYNSNRWYLLAYTILSFFIPFVDISLVLHKNEWSEMNIVQWVPVIYESATPSAVKTMSINYWFIGGLFILSGMLFMLCRLLIQFISFRKMMRKAEFISGNEMKIYQVNDSIIPFSFGNSIFINRYLHSEDELKEIIRHEFIHVKQRHSFDIIWGEIICFINWYNPFAWLLRKSIRQNLEFIADNKVLENGISKKEYQYLLLKVTGNNQYSIATQFNFSSLKKRIAMMNKLKSTKRQLLRMLFLLPATAVLLLAFRNKMDNETQNKPYQEKEQKQKLSAENINDIIFTDTVPEVNTPNEKGYYINVKGYYGECVIVVKDKNKKEVKRLKLTEWNEKADYYENLYGEIPPPPPPPPSLEQWIKNANKDVKSVSVINGLATVTFNNGKTENYDLTNKEQKENFEKKYGEVPEPPLPPVALKAGEPALPPVPPTAPLPPTKVIGVKEKADVKANYDIKDDVITVKLKDGRKEVYDLRNANQKKQFTEKYGDPVLVSDISTTANININSKVNQALVTTVNSNLVSNNNINAVTIANSDLNTTNAAIGNVKIATTVLNPVNANITSNVNVAVEPALSTTVNANANIDFDIVITITKNTTAAELEKLITTLKEKGYELKFTNKNYNDGMLTNISGVIKYKDSSSTFSVTDFSDVTIAVFREGDKVSFKILTDIKKAVI